MEQILLEREPDRGSGHPLKPISTAISIGTGGPFGAEGPIIASGGALGSMVGQVLRVTADERKTLLAAGAAAGMAATFGAPVSATLLAIELLLFEYRPRSLAPVALATAAATAIRYLFHGIAPVFPMPDIVDARGRGVDRLRASRRRRRSALGAGHSSACTGSRTPSSSCRSTGCGGPRSVPSWSA